MNTLADLAVLRPDAKARRVLAIMMGLLVASCATSEATRDRTEITTQPRTIKAAPAVTPQTVPATPISSEPPLVRTPTTVPTNDPPLAQLKSKYERMLRDLDRARDKSITDAPALYRLYLQNLEKQFVDKGELDSVVAVRAETSRFGATGVVTTNDLVLKPEFLLLAQKSFMQAPVTAEQIRMRSRDELSRAYLKALEVLKVDLTKQAMIPEAIAAAEELERMRPLVPELPPATSGPPVLKPIIVEKRLEPVAHAPTDSIPAVQRGPVVVPTAIPANLRNGLLLFYPLDGTGEDRSESGRHAKLVNVAPATNRLGKAKSALSVKQDGDHITPLSMIWPSSVTVSMWVKLSPESDPRWLLLRGYFGFHVLQSKRNVTLSVFNARDERRYYRYVVSDCADNNWHHLAFSYGPAGFIAYVDGAERFSSKALGTGPIYYPPADDRLWPNDFQIAKLPPGKGVLTGKDQTQLDDIGIWNRQLSAAEIRQAHALR